ncbi:MAG: gamma-glutamylcyclotransferase family protein [Ornithinimicrobium sp.]|uniref:gamma-glutamylcyclotransferase family protein n=1 Tax=Ornithinimicrobium sp. TaxID=1977084 RepID=UPI003D9AB66F
MGVAVFGYGSLVDPRSAAATLGRPVGEVWPARLSGWRRRFSTVRDNLTSEKAFARVSDGWLPPIVLALNLERDTSITADPPNGALVEVEPAELDRLDRRELRYDRIDVTDQVRAASDIGQKRTAQVFAYVAKAEQLAVHPPPGAVVLASYVAAVEAAFESLGRRELAIYRRTTGSPPVEVIDARLIRGEVPDGNPRAW